VRCFAVFLRAAWTGHMPLQQRLRLNSQRQTKRQMSFFWYASLLPTVDSVSSNIRSKRLLFAALRVPACRLFPRCVCFPFARASSRNASAGREAFFLGRRASQTCRADLFGRTGSTASLPRCDAERRRSASTYTRCQRLNASSASGWDVLSGMDNQNEVDGTFYLVNEMYCMVDEYDRISYRCYDRWTTRQFIVGF
jgi:hypothetical protein